MSSYLELKIEYQPQHHRYDLDQYMQNLILTFPRDQVPILFDGRVPLSVWQDTYDQLLAKYRAALEVISKLTPQGKTRFLILIPCLVPVFLPILCWRSHKLANKAKEHEQAFVQFCQDQAAIYRPYGVQVTLAKELISHGFGSDRHMENEVVGLRFDVVAAATTTGMPTWQAPTSQAQGYVPPFIFRS